MHRHQGQSSCCVAVVCSSHAAVCCCLQLPCGCLLLLCGCLLLLCCCFLLLCTTLDLQLRAVTEMGKEHASTALLPKTYAVITHHRTCGLDNLLGLHMTKAAVRISHPPLAVLSPQQHRAPMLPPLLIKSGTVYRACCTQSAQAFHRVLPQW